MFQNIAKITLFPFLAGCLAALSMPTSFESINPVSPLFMFAGLSALFLLFYQAQKPGTAFLTGWFFGFGYFLIGLYWIGNALLVEGNEYRWAWPIAVCGLPFLLSFFSAINFYASKKILNNQSITTQYLLFCIALAISEWIRGHIFTGFPWNLLGYSWFHYLSIIQISAFGGPYFLTTLTLLWCGLPAFIYLLFKHKERHTKNTALLLVIILSFALNFGWGSYRLSNNPTEYESDVTVRIVQPNIPQHEKWEQDKLLRNFRKTIALSTGPLQNESPLTYVIWPETTLSYPFLENATLRKDLSSFLKTIPGKTYLMSGILRRQKNEKEMLYFNSFIVFTEEENIESVYNKSHLVPFGEYIPFSNWIPIETITNFSGFKKGKGPESLNTKENTERPFTPLICYEIIFPGNVSHKDSTYIINVTNDAWYGESSGPYQHFYMAVFRSIEEGLPVIRVANTGISGILDPMGRKIIKTDSFTNFYADSKIPKNLKQKTFYYNNKDIPFFTFITFLVIIIVNKRLYYRLSK